MPDVTGMTYDNARSALKDLGFSKIDTVKENGKTPFIIAEENWVVLSQDPASGTEVPGSTQITLTVKNVTEVEADKQDAQRAALIPQLDALTGQPYTTAYETLGQLGLTGKWIHSTSRQDFTESVKLSVENPDPEFEVPWIIVGYENLNVQNMTVTILINTQENLDSKAAADSMESTLKAKLDPVDAWIAAEDYGASQYPYGFKLHYMVGKLAETAEDENTWFLKATCDVTNQYGATTKDMVCEAMVTGTSDNPQVVSFIVY